MNPKPTLIAEPSERQFGGSMYLRNIMAVAATMGMLLVVQTADAAPITGIGGKCIDVPRGNTADGTQVTLYKCDGSPEQEWQYTPKGTLVGIAGKCLDVWQGKTDDGAAVKISVCDGSPEQQWQYVNGALVGIGGKCLDVPDGKTADGTPLHIYSCDGSPEQQWKLP